METISVSLDYSHIGRRAGAFAIDVLFLGLVGGIANSIIPIVGGLAVWFLYAPLLEASEIQGTLGKQLLGIQVADLSGRRISLKASVIRNAMKFVSTILVFIGFVMALFSDRKQSLHDLLADTVVVYGRSDQPILEVWVQSMKSLFRTAGEHKAQDRLTALERLQRLRDSGVLSEDEFQAEKKKLLS